MAYAKRSIFNDDVKFDRGRWEDVFSASLGKVIAQQMRCNDIVIRERDWHVNLAEGILSFDSDRFPIQFIGSESRSSGTWLWVWDNINNFSESALKRAREIRAIGEANNLAPLIIPEIELNDIYNGYTFSVVACALSNEKICYYRIPHDGGAFFLTFSPQSDEVFSPVPAQEFVNTVMTCIKTFTVDHRVMVESFLYQNDTEFEWDGDAIVAHFEKDTRVEFEYVEEVRRIKRMSFSPEKHTE